MPRLDSAYGGRYGADRAAILATRPHCALRLRCTGALATEVDHVPPLALHEHVPGSGCCRLRPACGPCQRSQGRALQTADKRRPPKPSRKWL